MDRDQALRRGDSVFPQGSVMPGSASVLSQATPPAGDGRQVISGDELRAAGLPSGAPVTTTPLGAPGQSDASAAPDVFSTPAPAASTSPGISDEQDFAAVSERQTIESDAERLARQRAAYQVVQPTAVPTRPDSAAPNIVAYALSSTNALGQSIYRRSGFNADSKFLRACANYSSSDRAQEDFLANGGPERDRLGVDPDGDGFACYWDPTPFRAAAQRN